MIPEIVQSGEGLIRYGATRRSPPSPPCGGGRAGKEIPLGRVTRFRIGGERKVRSPCALIGGTQFGLNPRLSDNKASSVMLAKQKYE